jgi:hypothetical protein
MRARWTIAALLLVVLATVTLPAPLAGADQDPGAEPTIVHIYASDFSFVLDRTIIPAGPVQFEMLNLSDEYRHEVWIYPIDERDAHHFHEMLDLKRTGERADETEYIDGIVARSGEVAAGDATSFAATLPPGTYEVACLAREGTGDMRMLHYDEGMFAVLAVRAATSP